jgi:hypothetical protein
MTDLSAYERLGDPDEHRELTKAEHRSQAQLERICAHAKVVADDFPPLTDEQIVKVRLILSEPTHPTTLMRWRLRLYCGHITERTAHASYLTSQQAFGLGTDCPQCPQEQAIIAAEPLGLASDTQPPAQRAPEQPSARPKRPTRAQLEDRIAQLEAENAALRNGQ